MKQILLLFLAGWSFIAGAQDIQRTFSAAFQQFQNDENLKHATVGLFVLDQNTGKTIIAQNIQTGLAPASTQKVITAATAYQLLGKDFKYKTEIGYTGRLENGILNGDIIIRGSGDPTLGSERYAGAKEQNIINEIVSAVLQAGIKEISGHVLPDETLFDSQVIPDGWIWQDMGNYYGAGARALNWRENQFDLFLKSGSVIGDDVEISGTNPAFIPGLNLKSELKSAAAGSGDNAYIYPSIFGQPGYVRGTIPVNQKKFSISGTIPNAALLMAMTVEAALKKQPISKIASDYPSSLLYDSAALKTIYTIESPALDSICYWFLQKSINLYGEALLKTLGRRFGKGGSTSEGVKVIQDFWKKQEIENYALNIMDGSGLSPQDRVTTDAMVKVLLFAKKQPWFDSYFKGFPVINGIKMKSGSINGVASYTGFIPSMSGNYVFAFIVNNYYGSGSQIRKKMWQLLDILK